MTRPIMLPDNIKELFPDYKSMKPGTWSKHGYKIPVTDTNYDYVEIGLYREPESNEEYAGDFTLQVFEGDDVVVCTKIEATE